MTRKVLFGSAAVVATLVVLGGAVAVAQGMGHRWGEGPGANLIERFDRSGDGRVSQADVDAVRAERFAAFDTDGDGVLSLQEYEALWLDAMRPRLVRDFQRLDVDGDAGVTEAEFMAPYSRLVQRLDRDGDGVITEAELRERMRERRGELRGRGDGPRGDGRGPRGDGRGPRGPVD